MRILIITILIDIVCSDQPGYNYHPMSYSGIGLFHTPDAGIRKTFYSPDNTYSATTSKSSSSYNKSYLCVTPNAPSADSEISHSARFYTEPYPSLPSHTAATYYPPSYLSSSSQRASYATHTPSTSQSSAAYSSDTVPSSTSYSSYSLPSYTESTQSSFSHRASPYYFPSYTTSYNSRSPPYSPSQITPAYPTHVNPRSSYATHWQSAPSELLTHGTPSYPASSSTPYTATASNTYIPPPSAPLRKQFYTFSVPESEFDDSYAIQDLANRVKQAVRVVFIKGPENKAFENAALTLAQQAAQQHTAIYVLNKQPDIAELANTFNAIGKNANIKPDVHFVKYRTPEDAVHAQKEIQHQYDLLDGNSERVDNGVARVINFASQPSVDSPSGQQIRKSYLTSSLSSSPSPVQ